MIEKTFFVGFILISIFAQPMIGSTSAVSAATLTLEQSIHFFSAEGSDVVIEPGTYQVEAAEEWLRVISGKRRDALLLDTSSATHHEAIDHPLVRLIPGEEDQYSLVLLLPNGTTMEASGSVSGVRSRAVRRARVARAPKARQQVMKNRQQPPTQSTLKKTSPYRRAPVQQNPGGGSTPATATLEQRVHTLEQQVNALLAVLQVTQSGATLQAKDLSLLSDNLTIQTQGPQGIIISSTGDLRLNADLNLTAEGGIDLNLKGGVGAKLEGGSGVTVTGGGITKIEGIGQLDLKGPFVYLGSGDGKKPLALVGSNVNTAIGGGPGQVTTGSVTVFSK